MENTNPELDMSILDMDSLAEELEGGQVLLCQLGLGLAPEAQVHPATVVAGFVVVVRGPEEPDGAGLGELALELEFEMGLGARGVDVGRLIRFAPARE